jgi:hypothetical protein
MVKATMMKIIGHSQFTYKKKLKHLFIFTLINSQVRQTCVFTQSERLLSSNQKCLSR